MESARNQLEDIVNNGVVGNIFDADEAFALYNLIGLHSESINAATFGEFFGRLQRILLNQLILSVNRLFEKEGRRYPIRSIPAAIKVLHERADELLVESEKALAGIATRYSLPETEKPQPERTREIAGYFEGCLHGYSTELESLKVLRDKFIAHPEAVPVEDLPTTTPGEIRELLGFAKRFTHTIGLAYLSTNHACKSGGYMLTRDAHRASVCLERLLESAGCSAFSSKLDIE